ETENRGDDEHPSTGSPLSIGAPVTDIDAGAQHTCAVTDAGAVHCWGQGDLGRLGSGNENAIGDNEAPTISVDLSGGTAVKVVAGGAFSCALLTTGEVRCWGSGAATG